MSERWTTTLVCNGPNCLQKITGETEPNPDFNAVALRWGWYVCQSRTNARRTITVCPACVSGFVVVKSP
jgi:hypothetical protein